MQEDERRPMNNHPGSQRNDSSNARTVESLAAALEQKALRRLGKSSDASNASQEGTDAKTTSQDGTAAMRAMLNEKLKILEKRTDEEIKRIVRREYMKDAVADKD